ncbi:MAG: molybdenum cofactor guanylyltransferase [Alphaproteobacteria bacterium]|nr:molybdenum cofactor guanylyltransferase [Alphaproteobacteria bacterium]
MQAFTGVILAGGASRRMGRDKAMIAHNGKPLIQHMAKILTEAGAEEMVILGRPDLPGGIPDHTPGAGPVTALVDYLASRPSGSRHIIIPVDMPALKPEAIIRLARMKGWAHFERHMLPMLATAGHRFAPQPRRLRDLLAQHGAAVLPLSKSDTIQFTNLNTPNDLKHWRGMNAQAEGTSHV